MACCCIFYILRKGVLTQMLYSQYNGSWLVARGISFVKRCIKKIIRTIIYHLPKSNIILFESYPDFTDNTYPLFLELQKLLPKYKMVWLVDRFSAHVPERRKKYNIVFTDCRNFAEEAIWLYYVSRCKALIHCNRYKKKIKDSQLSIYLNHGTPLKNVKGCYDMKAFSVDYVNTISEYFIETEAQTLNCPAERFVCFGFPRCDYFYAPSRREDINDIVNGRYIIWLPTFRVHNSKTRDDAPNSVFNNIGVPLFYSVEALKGFNAFLQERNIHILYKPHFAQDLDAVKRETLSNFHIIYDEDILCRNLQLYEVIAQSEALITDYSSVFWDYMLLDRPIAITTDDIEAYRKGLGFVIDIESVWKETAETMQDSTGLCEFVDKVIAGIDTKQEGRRKWRDISNTHQDGKSAERAAKFIIDKLK